MPKKILIYIDHFERLNFWRRIISALKKEGIYTTAVVSKLSLWLSLKRYGVQTFLLKKQPIHTTFPAAQESLDVKREMLSAQEANQVFGSALLSTQKIIAREKIEAIFIWNGSNTISLAIAEAAKCTNVPCLFFEISNFQSRIFVSKGGVNAKSRLYDNPEILDPLPDESAKLEDWLQTHYKYKSQTLPQAKSIKFINYFGLIDRIGYFFSVIRDDKTPLYKQALQRLSLKGRHKMSVGVEAKLDSDYVFLPLQVSDDSQILINSEIDNFKAITLTKDYAEKRNLQTYIKIHPAERNQNIIKAIKEYAQLNNIKIVTNNTLELVQNAKKVFVINSTVGLEALLLKKEVKVLGKAIYENFDTCRASKFLFHYLINIDYFSDTPISKEQINKILDLLTE